MKGIKEVHSNKFKSLVNFTDRLCCFEATLTRARKRQDRRANQNQAHPLVFLIHELQFAQLRLENQFFVPEEKPLCVKLHKHVCHFENFFLAFYINILRSKSQINANID